MSYKAARCKRAWPRGGGTLQNGIRADSCGFTGTYGRKCAGMSTGAWGTDVTGMWTGAWRVSARASGMCRWHWAHGHGTGTVGTGRTDVAHGLLALDVRDVCKHLGPQGMFR